MIAAEQLTVTGVVLAGGQGRRMGGVDKGQVIYRGKPLIEYALETLSACEELIINTNQNHADYQNQYPHTHVITDVLPDFSGPLMGMYSALLCNQTLGLPWILTCPCDAPAMPNHYVQTMLEASQMLPKVQLWVAWDGTFLQPVFALLHQSLLAELAHFLQSQPNRKILTFYDQVGYQRVLFSNPAVFANLNRPDDLQTKITL